MVTIMVTGLAQRDIDRHDINDDNSDDNNERTVLTVRRETVDKILITPRPNIACAPTTFL